jgi:hypothetical protein
MSPSGGPYEPHPQNTVFHNFGGGVRLNGELTSFFQAQAGFGVPATDQLATGQLLRTISLAGPNRHTSCRQNSGSAHARGELQTADPRFTGGGTMTI